MDKIVDRLRRRVKALDMTQMQIQEKTGVSQAAVNKFLQGKTQPTLKTYMALLRLVESVEKPK
jgi:predicted transcriptional regulator